MLLTTRCHPHISGAMHEPDHSQDAKTHVRGQVCVPSQGSAVKGHQKVDGDGVCAHLLQLKCHFHQLLVGLTHAGD